MQPLISDPMTEAPHDIPISEPPDASVQTHLLIDDDLPTSSEYETDNDRTVLSTSLPPSLYIKRGRERCRIVKESLPICRCRIDKDSQSLSLFL